MIPQVRPTGWTAAALNKIQGLKLEVLAAGSLTYDNEHLVNGDVAHPKKGGQPRCRKGGRLRYVPLTQRLTDALSDARHLRGVRVVCDAKGQPLTQKVIQGLMRRIARRANVRAGVHVLRHTFCSHLAMRGAPTRAIQELAAAERAPESGLTRRGDSIAGNRHGDGD